MAELADAKPVGDLAGGFEPATREQWLELVDKVLRGRPLETLHSRTSDGLDVAPLYTSGPDESTTGAPGASPHTRSFTPQQRPDGRWDIRSVVDGSTTDAGESVALDELQRGATSLLVRGAALASRETLGGALEGVHLDLAPVVLEPASAFTATAEWLMELWSANGVSDDAAKGGFGADPLGLLARTGSLPQGVDRAMADAAGLASMAAHRMPGVRSLTVDATVYAEAGASDALELAAMLCTVVAYLRAMAEAGVDADSAAGQIEVVLGTDTDFFTTVAKLRAARTTLSGVLEASGAHPGSAPPSIVARTLDRSLSRVDPWVNLLRVTAGAFAAALGGADAVVTSAFDSQLGQPSDLGRRMARNTQLLLAEESNVGRVIDPAGGSWYVESLTDSIARRAWELFGELESAGGMAAVLGDSSLARRIEVVRDERFSAVADRSAPLTGVSEFPNLGEDLPETAPRGAASPPEAAATDSATSCEALRGVRWAEPFERLREAADRVRTESSGAGPRVFLANLGDVATHTARSSWARNFFEAGGIAGVTSARGASSGFSSPEEVVEDFGADGASLVCLCSSDEHYAEVAADVARALGAAGARRIYLAGRPGDLADELRAAGVDTFVHRGTDVLEVLTEAHRVIGVPTSEAHATSEAQQ